MRKNQIKNDLAGKKFGRLTAIEIAGTSKQHVAVWRCICDCGNEKLVERYCLTQGRVRSCGCLPRELNKTGNNRRVHGMCGTRIYRIWKQMKTRCSNPNTDDWKDYGGRGITVCEEWQDNFQAFYEWAMANGYQDDLTIDRIDYDKGYSPDNCKWADITTQANNRHTNHLITINGTTKTCMEWIKDTGISKSTFYQRLRKGISGEALITPPQKRRETS